MMRKLTLIIALAGFAGLMFASVAQTLPDDQITEEAPADLADPFAEPYDPFAEDDDESFDPFADSASDPFEFDADEPLPMLPTKGATLRGLDKITGRAVDIDVGVGDGILIGGLWVVLQACYASPPEEIPESAAFLQIEDQGFSADPQVLAVSEADPEKRVFSGWMFSSSPGLSALEHPLYDVWVIKCITKAPAGSSSASNPRG